MSSTSPLCQNCRQRPATVFMTQIVDNQATQRRYCEQCAREMAAQDGLMQFPDLSNLPEGASQALSEALQQLPLDDIIRSLFGTKGLEIGNDGVPLWLGELNGEFSNGDHSNGNAPHGEFSGDEDEADEQAESEWDEGEAALDEFEDSDEDSAKDAFDELLSTPSVSTARCPKCETTWDRLKQDGRAGCSQCYVTFEPQLREVMGRLQRGETHVGKTPRAREKRRRRLEHLRKKRDNRLEMLNRRLAEAVREERYEDAAKLRDKIRIVASTIVSQEGF